MIRLAAFLIFLGLGSTTGQSAPHVGDSATYKNTAFAPDDKSVEFIETLLIKDHDPRRGYFVVHTITRASSPETAPTVFENWRDERLVTDGDQVHWRVDFCGTGAGMGAPEEWQGSVGHLKGCAFREIGYESFYSKDVPFDGRVYEHNGQRILELIDYRFGN